MYVEHFENNLARAKLIAINTTEKKSALGRVQRSEHRMRNTTRVIDFHRQSDAAAAVCVVDLVRSRGALGSARQGNSVFFFSLEMIRAIVRNDLLKLKLVRCVKKELLIDFIDTNIFFTQQECSAAAPQSSSAS